MSTITATPPAKKKMSPRKKARLIRNIQYGVLVLALIVLVSVADGHQLQQVFFRPDLIAKTISPLLLRAMMNTILYTLGAFVFGLVLGTILALMRLSSVGPYRWIATIYTEFFRGVPAIIVFLAFNLLPVAFPNARLPFEPYGTVWTALGLVSAAYISETIRAGIQAVPKGQLEAARSLGMPSGMAMQRIVLPQAFRVVIPPLTNELVLMTKDSSLVYVLGLTIADFELTKFGRDLGNANSNLTPLIVAGLCYLIITLPLSYLVRRMEAKARKSR